MDGGIHSLSECGLVILLQGCRVQGGRASSVFCAGQDLSMDDTEIEMFLGSGLVSTGRIQGS